MFLYWVGFERHFREELTKRKWLFYRILTFSTHLTYFKVNIMPRNVLGNIHILEAAARYARLLLVPVGGTPALRAGTPAVNFGVTIVSRSGLMIKSN